ncbi:MAG: hypothetical protein SGBAC_009631 [Bacillariaceae sp.]
MTSVASSATGSSFQSSLTPAGWRATDNDRMLHDEESDASSSYYFLKQFGSVDGDDDGDDHNDDDDNDNDEEGLSAMMANDSVTTSHLLTMMVDDPSIVQANSSSDESSTMIQKDRPVHENDSGSSGSDDDDYVSISRIGIQPLYPSDSMSFDTIMEMQAKIADYETDDDTQNDGSRTALARGGGGGGGDPYYHQTNRSRASNTSRSRDVSQNAYWQTEHSEEYSFFSGESEPQQTFWELLRLQTLLGSCTQPQNDSFDELDDDELDKVLGTRYNKNRNKRKKNNDNKANQTNDKPKQGEASEGWVFFGLWTSEEEEKKEDSTPSSPNKQDLQKQLMTDLDPKVGDEKKDSTVAVVKGKMKSLLGRLKRNASDNVRSVKLAASFATEDGSILNTATNSKYAKFEEGKEAPKPQSETSDQQQEQQERQKQKQKKKKKRRSKARSQPKQPPLPENGLFCNMSDQFASMGCYDDACAQHPSDAAAAAAAFDDFGVDPNQTRNYSTKWAQFETGFPKVNDNDSDGQKTKSDVNTSYISTETATTAEMTLDGKSPKKVATAGFELDRHGPKTTPSATNQGYPLQAGGKRYDSEYGSGARNSFLPQPTSQRRRKSQRKLGKRLKKIKRRFSKTKAEI